ncbi:E3 ubiquitin-protein ligase MIB2-like [Strongylocentrotus purpuratus]|uniref:RING-type E3 ubiquitin transferase n=1 Tax=Strongylocentrotus purpuratus TaxID=7668 RepID=A0A7M7NYR2_STRPU|nr:E3 ubiquitin-protein ligase MIB2-like [Strongylocentrotus purpuratus]
MATVEVGQRVVRSATWTSGDEDGGEGHLGTVVKLKDQDPQDPIPSGWAKIRWDNGNVNNYQVGSSGSYDLALFDSAPAGVIRVDAVCDSCLMDPIAGIPWKCSDESCPNYVLCTPCYMNDRHDLTHTFTRFTSQKETGTQVTPRFGEVKTVSRGLCPEAEVCRGKDWQGDDEDSAGGTVVEICPFSERQRSGVTVCWTQSKLVTTHRVGFDGKMDLKYTRAGTGIGYYATHLPLLDARPDGSGHTEIVKPLPPLLETEASSSSDSDSGEGGEESQLINAASRGNVERVVEILSTSPEKANAKIDGKTALHIAAIHGHLEVVQALIESGAEMDITDNDGDTPLLYSVEGNQPAITKYLIGKGADINRGNDTERRAIHHAAYRGFVDCARVLINHGCDVNVQDAAKDTPLHDAIFKSVDVVELLVKVPNLDVTLANKIKMTPLQLAAGLGKPE